MPQYITLDNISQDNVIVVNTLKHWQEFVKHTNQKSQIIVLGDRAIRLNQFNLHCSIYQCLNLSLNQACFHTIGLRKLRQKYSSALIYLEL